jgi:hypothetical protein
VLLREAVEGAEPPDEVDRVDADDGARNWATASQVASWASHSAGMRKARTSGAEAGLARRYSPSRKRRSIPA